MINKSLAYLFLAVALALTTTDIHAQDGKLFDGGMMVHAGYLTGQVEALDYKSDGAVYGLGGVLRIHIGRHLRLGAEGCSSTVSQKGVGSYIRMGFGGVLADTYWTLRRWMPYGGLAVGGGRCSTLLIFSGNDDDWIGETDAVLHNEAFFYVNPYLGVEYLLTNTIHLTFKVDRLTPLSGEAIPTGVRLYLGFIFSH